MLLRKVIMSDFLTEILLFYLCNENGQKHKKIYLNEISTLSGNRIVAKLNICVKILTGSSN